MYSDRYICSRFYYIPQQHVSDSVHEGIWHIGGYIAQASAKTWQVFHILAMCISVYTHTLLGQGTITDTSKYTYYLATTCLSFIFQTWLSQEHARLAVIPVNLTVPAHLHCSRTPDISLAVTTGHNLSQLVTTRWNQSRTVISFWWHKGDSTLLCLLKVFCVQTWLGVLSTCVTWEVRQKRKKVRYLCGTFISGFQALMTTRFFFIVANSYQPGNRLIRYLWKISTEPLTAQGCRYVAAPSLYHFPPNCMSMGHVCSCLCFWLMCVIHKWKNLISPRGLIK